MNDMDGRKTTKRINLTIRSVAALDPEDGNRIVWDARLPGFGVRISTGGAKAFVLKYKFKGQQRMMTLGRLGDDLTVDQARGKAETARGQVRAGIDPQAERDRDAIGGTLSAAWAKYVDHRSRFPFGRRGPWKASTKRDADKYWRNYIKPRLGNRPTASITLEDIEALRDDILNGKLNKEHRWGNEVSRKGGKATARLTSATLSGFFAWAIFKRIYTGPNPVKGVAQHESKARERVLSDDEFNAFMTAVDAYDGNVFAKAALKLYVFTACRSGEILSLKWTDVMLDGAYLRLKDAKGGDRNVPLTEDAIAVLSSLPRMPENPYVICGHKRGEHLVNIRKPFLAVLALAGIVGVTIHDLRRTYGSQCLLAGVDIYSLSKLLGHASVTTTERAYAFMPKEVLRAASKQVADRMREAAAGTHNKVVPLRRPA